MPIADAALFSPFITALIGVVFFVTHPLELMSYGVAMLFHRLPNQNLLL